MYYRPILLFLLGLGTSLNLQAQKLYDLSDSYLVNSGFDSNYDYVVGDKGNVTQEMKDLAGWTKDFTVAYTISGVYQLGTDKRFNGTVVPALGYDGTANGGVLALSTGWNQQLKFYQTVTLPAGTYTLASAFYNNTTPTAGGSLVGWIPQKGSAVMSQVKSFASKAWTADSVTFTLTEQTTGKIQIGYVATQNSGSNNHAKVVLDYVKLLRTTPVGKTDVDLKKQSLSADLDKAKKLLEGASGESADVFKAVVDEAQQVYDNADATIPEVYAVQQKLTEATEVFYWANPTGEVPTVTTDKRFARGATMAFARINVSGKDVVEKGICWSTSPNPTIKDNRTTTFINQKGAIYWLKDLQPSTKYYMRAYAITKGKQVGYGDVVKFYTIPRGNLSYSMRSGGDADAVSRINAAMTAAVGWWKNLTSIQGVNFNVGHNPGTPTADCSYGGYIRVGSNASYQRTGTMLHEMAHGVGIGTHDPYWSGEIRANGDRGIWQGEHVTNVIRFWDNDNNATVTGDRTHFWPYGINGAHEDNGSDALYIIQSLIVQAFGEDGLPPSGGFASPVYSFEQEDTVKYYLKNESEDYGLYSSYMVEKEKGGVELRTMSNAEALANDSAAWIVTYNPTKAFYAFKNVATGRYLTYLPSNNGIGTASVTNVGANNLFHLMRSRVNVSSDVNLRGYWIIHNTNVEYPNTMAAKNGTNVGNATYNLANSAKAQRWLILTPAEMDKLETAAQSAYSKQLSSYIATVKKLRTTPHKEDVEGTDKAFDDQMAAIEAELPAAVSATEVSGLLQRAKQAGFDFLSNATPLSTAQPFDLTFMLMNPGMDNVDGWNGTPALNFSCAEFYQATFDFYQTLTNLPAGSYQVKAQAFQRPGSAAQAYTDYAAGADKITTSLYAGSNEVKVKNAVVEARKTKIGIGNESNLASSPVTYIPNDMQSAGAYFGKSLYDNEVFTEVGKDGGNLRLGIRCTSTSDRYWSIFDNFRLYYYGSMKSGVVAGIETVDQSSGLRSNDVYSIDGRLVRKQATSLEGLPHGIYIVNGKKVIR